MIDIVSRNEILIECRTISPLRVKRMQEESQSEGVSHVDGLARPKKEESESQADRALTVVAKKLSKTLSVGATVNELIQQATDEKNLAVLYSGKRSSGVIVFAARLFSNLLKVGRHMHNLEIIRFPYHVIFMPAINISKF